MARSSFAVSTRITSVPTSVLPLLAGVPPVGTLTPDPGRRLHPIADLIGGLPHPRFALTSAKWIQRVVACADCCAPSTGSQYEIHSHTLQQPGKIVDVDRRYPCVCCGHLTLNEPPGSYNICPVCFWEDDLIQLRWPDYSGGANKPCLIEAQRAFGNMGAKESRLFAFVRAPSDDEPREQGWRPAEPEVDNFEHRGEEEEEMWPDDATALYWWRPTFWRGPQA